MQAATFWDRIAPRYAKSKMSDPDGYEATLARTVSHLHEGDEVLEIGCGTGSTALRLAPHVRSLTGTDISPAMIEIAREKAWNDGPGNVTFAVADAAAPSGRTYDAVLAHNLLHLVPDLDAALAAAAAQVRPGGLLIAKTPCLGGNGARSLVLRAMVGAMALAGKAPPVRFFSIAALEDAIARAGFASIERLVQPGLAPRLYLVARRA
ncbi:MAG: class I SAM-dependent methyltransferase [Hasllibacter sp.]